ncbi:MAG: SCO family protein [Deltaproteobacteria bacterium]|nr:MAG: SCO family protein [Deltaproteobacteria bacterium]
MSRSMAGALWGMILATLAFGCGDEALPDLGSIPEMSLIDQNGQAFDRSDLEGRTSIVDFVFTRCPAICPLLSQKMAHLQQRYEGAGDDVQLVSISVDPEYDTPEVLLEYAGQYRADPARWRLLTGDADDVNRIVVSGFRQAMGEPERTAEGGVDVMHSSHFVLVDRTATIRGFYSNDADGTATLLTDVERLRSGR